MQTLLFEMSMWRKTPSEVRFITISDCFWNTLVSGYGVCRVSFGIG